MGAATMPAAPVRKLFRCAIYTRKSTDHNLDLAFTSLDAQREACEACIRSQTAEGWRLVPTRYDDGAYSGASLQRPALQALLSDVQVRRLDIVVVYKVDRLTRSLADFAKLIELFDAQSVSFVSVTQAFNTSSSMGRLTLNVLLSFAQFERELIGERVRDKIAASKRKGLWVGGPVPLGYAAIDKTLVLVPAEAEAVRTIFARYLELGSVRALSADLQERGIRSKERRLADGRIRGGGSFGVGALAYLLKNRCYIGEVVYGGEVHRGDHLPILPRPLFEAVQERLATQAVAQRSRLRGSRAVLTGRLFDDRGNRMSPSHTSKGGLRYRYYVSQAVLRNRPDAAAVPPARLIVRVAAPDIEAQVLAALRQHLQVSGRDAASPEMIDDRALIERHVERVTVTAGELKLLLRQSDPPSGDELEMNVQSLTDPPEGAPTMLVIPWARPAVASDKGVVHVPVHNTPLTPSRRDAVLIAIAKARRWVDELAHGRAADFAVIARREGMAERHVRRLAPLAFVSPRIVAALLDGTVPADLTITTLARTLPWSWAEQERLRRTDEFRESMTWRTLIHAQIDGPLTAITGDHNMRTRRGGPAAKAQSNAR